MAFLFDKLQHFFLLTSTRITFDFIKFNIKAKIKRSRMLCYIVYTSIT